MQVGRIRSIFTVGDGGLQLPQLGVAIHDVIDSRAAAAWAFLRNVGNLIPGIQDEFALVRFQLAEEHGKQRGLAAAVGPDDANPLAGVSLEAGIFDQDLGAASQADV